MTWADVGFLAGAIVFLCGALIAISLALGGESERTSYRR